MKAGPVAKEYLAKIREALRPAVDGAAHADNDQHSGRMVAGMNLPETIARLEAIAAGNPTAEDLREASDLCLLAKGWRAEKKLERTPDFSYYSYTWFNPDGTKLSSFEERPNVAADLQAAETHMVPDDCFWGRDRDTRFWVRRKGNPERPYYSPALSDEKTAVALCIASLKAENDDANASNS